MVASSLGSNRAQYRAMPLVPRSQTMFITWQKIGLRTVSIYGP